MERAAVQGIKLAEPSNGDGSAVAPAQGAWLQRLYTEHWSKCCAYLRRKYGAGPPEPEDCVQHAFAQLAKLDNGANALIAQPKSFLYRTAENALIDERRRDAHRRRHARDADAGIFAPEGCISDPETVLGTKDELAIIEATLRAMSERRRACFLMHRMDEMSFSEIGRELGISRQAVCRHIDEAMNEIGKAVAERNGKAT